ncbi:centrosomal protein of 290 kDa-like [Ictalurus furcatus]|uniref:centrosomal protein of 290 kDa-like n=1 Tax=Ictalurus furcatus TaxID=66913 RepID=UPI002350757A|nr:centrosomal protein of 290 kDa-like [Ictalurus furcatus]
MKKVVERVQREKELGDAIQAQLTALQHEHEKLKAEYDRTKEPNQLTSKLESQAKGMEKIVMENERLRRDIRKVSDSFGCGGGLGKRVHTVKLL